MARNAQNRVTRLLHARVAGDDAAAAELLPLVYNELRALAASFLGAANRRHTLQPTALVHEAYLKLVRSPQGCWEGRRHFLEVAAKAMRQILANHARSQAARKRGGGSRRVTLSGALPDDSGADLVADVLALEEALAGLQQTYPDLCRVVELRYFGGLSIKETALVLGMSERTVERDWRMAKAELRLRLLGADAAKQASPVDEP